MFIGTKRYKLLNASDIQISQALFNKGVALGLLKRPEEAIAEFYDDVINRYSNYDNTELRVQCANALFNKGVALGRLEKHDEELAAYDEVINRYSNDADPRIKALIDRIKNRR